MKHDEIVLQLDNETLTLLLQKVFGERSCWSQLHNFVQKDIEEWKKEEIFGTETVKGLLDYEFEFTDLRDIKNKLTKARNDILLTQNKNSLEIEKTFEYPLVKGEGKYKSTKGFIDLIVHAKPKYNMGFSTHKIYVENEFIIEIKKPSDFEDFGSVLRQIKEYREYYSKSCTPWGSNIISSEKFLSPLLRKFCVLSTSIPDKIKKLFEEEGIMCLELDSIKQTNN